jgi:hypothetical protein
MTAGGDDDGDDLRMAWVLLEMAAGSPDSDAKAADLDAAIQLARAALAALSGPVFAGTMPAVKADIPAGPDPAVLANAQAALGLALIERYFLAARSEARGSVPPSTDEGSSARANRDEGISLLRTAIAGLPPSDPIRWLINDSLGRALHDRYDDSWPGGAAEDPADLDEAVARLLSALAEDLDPLAGEYLIWALSDRIGLRGDDRDLDLLIDWGQRLLGSGMYTGHDGDFLHGRLGLALLTRGQAGSPGARTDLQGSIEHLEIALAGLPAEDPGRVDTLVSLAHASWWRLNGSATRYDEVDAMVSYAEAAWTALPQDHEDRAEIGIYQVEGIHEQLRRPDAPFDSAAASRAIDILTDIEPRLIGEPDVHLLVTVMLGHFLAARGQANGSRADLGAAQRWLLDAADALPAGDEWAETRQTLAVGMSVLAGLGMDADHIDRAIGIVADASAWPDPDRARAALTRGTLGMLLAQRAAFTGNGANLDQGIDHLTASYDMVMPGHPYRIAAAANLGAMLITRFFNRGQAHDTEAARFYLDVAGSLTGPLAGQVRSLMGDVSVIVTANRGMLGVIEGMGGQPGALDSAVVNLRAALTNLPPGHPYRDQLRSDLGLALAVRAASPGGRPGDLADAARELRAAVDAFPRNHQVRPVALLRASGALAAAGAATGDQRTLRQSIRDLSQELATLSPGFGGHFRYVALLGAAAQALHRLTGGRADLDAAIGWLEQARRGLVGTPTHPQSGNCLIMLARCYRARGDKAEALDAGLAALRSRGRDLLLQSGTARSLGFARIAAAEAAEIAAWCLDDMRSATAVEALEFGRGLILHAATSVSEVTDLLTRTGHQELAEQWQATAASPLDSPWDKGPAAAGYASDIAAMLSGTAALEVPDDLRERAVTALAGSAEEDRLLAPPSAAVIAAALTRTGADALVYLLPSADGRPGRAVLVPADSHAGQGPQQVTLPELRAGASGALRVYTEASAAVLSGPVVAAGTPAPGAGTGQAGLKPAPDRAQWREALGRLCEWAWPAVVLPILGRVQAWSAERPPRLVLIAAGELSLVPWHAARSGPVGSPGCRYLIEDAVISYAASGRQLVDVARREVLPLSAGPVIVGDPTGDLLSALAEAWAIRERCYPAGRYFGQPNPEWGKPADGAGNQLDVLHQLPSPADSGASVLHLGCHGVVVGSAPGQSHLLLAGGEELRVDAVLRRASGRRPESPGGLVSLAACDSDLAIDDYDEALTPATSFLAAGAATVVGARWQIPDRATSLLMFMFHHLLVTGDHSPRDALRLAQLWMLEPDRTPPPEMPQALAQFARGAALADVTAWAGLVHQGQ